MRSGFLGFLIVALAFLAYTGAGTMTLLLVLLATALSTAQDAEVSLA